MYYQSFGKIYDYIKQNIFDNEDLANDIINIGFWPGGDRDGNPFVTPDITRKVAQRLHKTVIKNYYRDLRTLKRKLTFEGVDHRINDLEAKMYRATYEKDTTQVITLDHFVSELETVKGILEREYASLYVNEINSLINKTKLFGFHFAILDIRQDSRVHNTVFTNMVKELIVTEVMCLIKTFCHYLLLNKLRCSLK